ncbi:MAG: hypothetical protein ACPH3N_14335 [Alcanivorax sediminis]|uniref:hypothetical protein n=1 Tax=Alcanivorax sediminis TaxID=2663008 RepID=UPI003C69C74B
MSEARFHVVFAGQLVKGADPDTVKANLGRLFKMDAARVEKLFSGQPVVLKKDADQATAMKFRAALKQAGAECVLKPLEGEMAESTAEPVAAKPEEPVASSPGSASAAPAQEQSTGDLETVGTIRTGGTGFSGAFSVADVGEDMDNSEHAPPPPAPDVSHLSMAGVGEDLGQKKKQEDIKVPDISHLSLSPDN